MKYYKFEESSGRLIGSTNGLKIYPTSIVRQVEGDAKPVRPTAPPEEFYFNYGPSTGGMIESVGIDFLTPGELITEADVNSSHKMRIVSIKGRSIGDAALIVERINAFHCASHSIAFASAIEDALGIEIPDGVMHARIIASELERIRSNLSVIERMCLPAGFGVPANQLAYLREQVSRLISTATGHRYFFNSVTAGGTSMNFSKIGRVTKGIAEQCRGIYHGLLESKTFMNRLINNGKVSSDSLVGPAARASGHRYDARSDSQTLDYSSFGFNPVLHTASDSFSRMQVRSEEIFQSAEIIEGAVELARSSLVEQKINGDGEGAGRVESPQGDLFYYVRVENSLLRDLTMVSPSITNINAFSQSMKGNIFTDFHFNWESFGIWISEAGVQFS